MKSYKKGQLLRVGPKTSRMYLFHSLAFVSKSQLLAFHHSPVIQRLQSFLSLALTQLGWIPGLEKCRSELYKPLRIDCGNFPHVLFCCKHKLMIHNPFWLSVKKRTRRVNVYHLVISYCAVTFLWIFPCCIAEETTRYRLLHT